ncbi:hypothetical protein ACRAWD_19560 [Caulobacter segnis]
MGLKCGGSDGFSGVTANPAGRPHRRQSGRGRRLGTPVLTEIPEGFLGAENVLLAARRQPRGLR